MAQVSNLKINLQTGGNDTLYATWDFTAPSGMTASTSIRAGDTVRVSAAATHWYTGKEISSWLKQIIADYEWVVASVDGNRVVLSADKNGLFQLGNSPIDIKYLTKVSDASDDPDHGFDGGTLDHYEVKWKYDTGNGVWFAGSSGNIEADEVTVSTYNVPDNAIVVKVSVLPVAKTRKVGTNDTPYWTGTAVTATYNTNLLPPEKPDVPTVELNKYELKASLENIDENLDENGERIPENEIGTSDEIEFQVYDYDTVVSSGICAVRARQTFYSCTVYPGGKFRVRCRAIAKPYSSIKVYSEWTDFSQTVTTIPAAVSGITRYESASETSVYLEWTPSDTAKSYDIEYTDNKNYFDITDQTTTKTGIENTRWEVTGLESGKEYFFRVRAVNDSGASAWTSELVSVTIGTTPEAPTTWSSVTTATAGDKVMLYWVHNSEDASRQTYAQIEFTINDVQIPDYEFIEFPEVEEDNEDRSNIGSFELDTSSYKDGDKIEWRVRTAGISNTAGKWSISRSVDIYDQPTLALTVQTLEDANPYPNLKSFPIKISGLAGPKTQMPIGYHLAIATTEEYKTVDNLGNKKWVSEGENVFEKYYDISDPLDVTLTPSDVDLIDGITYKLICLVSMNSGLSAERSITFMTSFDTDIPVPDASVIVDTTTYVAHIRPTCSTSDVSLTVYRREFDGSFKEIGTGLDGRTYVTDPHPALDYARYRIVATSNITGASGYYDLPGYPVNGKAVIIQWAEKWTKFDVWSEDEFEQPPWTGSMLFLPYDIDVQEGNNLDVSFVEYIGRNHPVSYYGTQVGETTTWNVDIPKSDKDTIYALRRLAKWKGDVYVREPSGMGFWASIAVSFSQKHCELIVPVTLDITRVEGGV